MDPKKTPVLTFEDKLFDRFQIRYEIPNFIKLGWKAKVTILSDQIREGKSPARKWLLLRYRKRMKKAYPENLIKRSQMISNDSFCGLSQEILSMMVEIIRIIRYGLIDTIPGMKKAILAALDNMPLENQKFNLRKIEEVYFPDMWDSGVGEQIFAKFVANICKQFELNEKQKNRIQYVLKNKRDKFVFCELARERIRFYEYFNFCKIVPASMYSHDEFTKALLEILNPKEDMVGIYDINRLLMFLFDVLDQSEMDKLLKKIPDLYKHEGIALIHSMFMEYCGTPEIEYH